MVSKGLHGVPGRARLDDENLPKDLRQDRHREHACQDAQGSPRQTRSSQPRVSAGHKGRGETSSGTQRTPGGEASAGRWWSPVRTEVSGQLRRRARTRQRMEYKDSIPMERQPTLPVTEILAAERQERSWESAPIPGWCHPSVADRGRGIGDLGMAGLNIGASARLPRGGRALLPAGASTPLGGGSGELPRTYSGSSARVDYRGRLEMNTQDSDEDALFRQELRPCRA
jgi:hypothetical protein